MAKSSRQLHVFIDAIKQSGAYSLPLVARRLSSIFLLPIYTRYMSLVEFGIMELLDVTLFLVSMLFGLKRSESLLYFYNTAQSDDERARVCSTNMLGSLFMGVLLAATGCIFAPQLATAILHNREYHGYVTLTFLNLLLVFPIDSGFAYLRATGQIKLMSTLGTARLLTGAGLNVLFLIAFGMTVGAFLWSQLITSFLLSGYFIIRIYRKIPWSFDRSQFKRDIAYGAPLALHGIAMLAVHYGDRFFLQRSVSLAEIGVYALAYKMGMLISYVHTPFDGYWRAQVFGILKRHDGEEIYVRMFTYLLAVVGSVFVGIVLFLEPLLKLAGGLKFSDAAQYIPVIALAYLIRALGDQFRVILRVENQNWREARITTIVAIVCVAAYIVLIPTLKVWGAVLATLIAFLTALALSYRHAQGVRRFAFEKGRILKIVLAGCIAIGLKIVFHPQILWVQIAAGILLFGVYVAALWILRWPVPEERRRLRQLTQPLLSWSARSAG